MEVRPKEKFVDENLVKQSGWEVDGGGRTQNWTKLIWWN